MPLPSEHELYARFGSETIDFECCDTRFEVHVAGIGVNGLTRRARATARSIERRLNAFDEDSAVATLNRDGAVEDPHVAALVRRGLAYRERTDGTFDITQGPVEHAVKAFVRGETGSPEAAFADGAVHLDGSTVAVDRPLDLNGLAKGYIVDRAYDVVAGVGRQGYVNGGGDVAGPTGQIGVESPYGDETPLTVLATDWHVASSGGYKRGRDAVDHIYNPATEEIGSAHDVVTVVAERDCTEADALATALAASPLDDALALADRWSGLEALVVHDGVFHRTEGFHEHVAADGPGARSGWEL